MSSSFIKSFTEEELGYIRLWGKCVVVWCIVYVFCHFFVWNPIKVKEVSDLQVYKGGEIYVDQRSTAISYRAGHHFSWMRLSVNGQKYQCDCTTHHCRVTNYTKDKLKLDEVSFFIINQRYCFVVETVKYDSSQKNRTSYSYYLRDKNIQKEQLDYWRPYVLHSDYHKKMYQYCLLMILFLLNILVSILHWSWIGLNIIFLFYIFTIFT